MPVMEESQTYESLLEKYIVHFRVELYHTSWQDFFKILQGITIQFLKEPLCRGAKTVSK